MNPLTRIFYKFKQFIKKKLAEFIYPAIKELFDLNFIETKKHFEEKYGKIKL